MQEALLQLAWKMQLFTASSLATTDGEPISIIHPGILNTDSGPDFTNARIRIGGTLWAGNVEIHHKSSGWLQHGHHKDRRYDNVILHIVYDHDMPHSDIPTLELKRYIPADMILSYRHLMETAHWIPCEKQLSQVPEVVIKKHLDTMVAERLEEKALRFEQRLMQNANDWEETAYQLLARGFGNPVNADPFERVARSVPLKTILRHTDNPMQIEALLFGQAGLLEGNFKAVYPHRLKAEYVYLRNKYRLEPIRALEWKFLRMRPAHFPTMRMSQFAALLASRDKLFAHLLGLESSKEAIDFFSVDASEFWTEHYHFKRASSKAHGGIGADFIRLQLINTVAPLLYLYGKSVGEEAYIQRAVSILEQLPSEKNQIITKWKQAGIIAGNAAESQALLHLRQQHCVHKHCLNCPIGYRILREAGKL